MCSVTASIKVHNFSGFGVYLKTADFFGHRHLLNNAPFLITDDYYFFGFIEVAMLSDY